MSLTTVQLLHHLQQLQTIRPIHLAYQKIVNYLIVNQYQNLIDEMLAPGYTDFKRAQQWFTDYYVIDQNNGPTQAHHIQQAIQNADPHQIYYTQPDYNYGYDYTPTQFAPVPAAELQASINELIQKIKTPAYRMYAG